MHDEILERIEADRRETSDRSRRYIYAIRCTCASRHVSHTCIARRAPSLSIKSSRGRGTGWYFPSYEFTATDTRRAVSLSSIGFYLYLVAENISDRCQRSDRRYPTDGSNVHVRVTCVHASHLSTSSSRMRAVPRTCFTVWYLIRLILANGKYLACFR